MTHLQIKSVRGREFERRVFCSPEFPISTGHIDPQPITLLVGQAEKVSRKNRETISKEKKLKFLLKERCQSYPVFSRRVSKAINIVFPVSVEVILQHWSD